MRNRPISVYKNSVLNKSHHLQAPGNKYMHMDLYEFISPEPRDDVFFFLGLKFGLLTNQT